MSAIILGIRDSWRIGAVQLNVLRICIVLGSKFWVMSAGAITLFSKVLELLDRAWGPK